MLFLVVGNKLQTWMAIESFENNIPVYLITDDVF